MGDLPPAWTEAAILPHRLPSLVRSSGHAQGPEYSICVVAGGGREHPHATSNAIVRTVRRIPRHSRQLFSAGAFRSCSVPATRAVTSCLPRLVAWTSNGRPYSNGAQNQSQNHCSHCIPPSLNKSIMLYLQPRVEGLFVPLLPMPPRRAQKGLGAPKRLTCAQGNCRNVRQRNSQEAIVRSPL
jgi:hypothetical protein